MDRHDLAVWLPACALLDYGALRCRFAAFAFGRGRLRRLHGRWCGLPPVRFDAIRRGTMAVCKLAILLFKRVLRLALRLTGGPRRRGRRRGRREGPSFPRIGSHP